jgi:hypothetical protein
MVLRTVSICEKYEGHDVKEKHLELHLSEFNSLLET